MQMSGGHLLAAGLDGGNTIMKQIPPAVSMFLVRKDVLFLVYGQIENPVCWEKVLFINRTTVEIVG